MHDAFAHVSDVLPRLESDIVLFVQVLAMGTHLLDEDLSRLFVYCIKCLFLVVLVSLGELGQLFDGLGGAPAIRQLVLGLQLGVLGHQSVALVPTMPRSVKLTYEGRFIG